MAGTAAQIMGIDQDQANLLFYVESWPEIFSRNGIDVTDEDGTVLYPGTSKYLEVVKARVEHFIATGGAE
jgi:hypothetical protein